MSGQVRQPEQAISPYVLPRLVARFIRDERGALLTMELILTATVVGIGVIVGLTSIRDSVTQEFGDVSAGMASIDHGYQYNEIVKAESIDNMRFEFQILGSGYTDESNYGEPIDVDPVDASPMCISITATAIADEI